VIVTQATPVIFASAAVVRIGRWDLQSTQRAIKLTYSSLVRSQTSYPLLFLHTDELRVIPRSTTMGTPVRISPVLIDMKQMLEASEYEDPWHALSRAKLDMVEVLINEYDKPVIWIDLDTFIFVDLASSFQHTSSWVLGFHHGGCEGKLSCASMDEDIHPAFDVQGDLWAMDLTSIDDIRAFENDLRAYGKSLPPYDLQGIFSMMLERGLLRARLLHHLLPFNFGFACSNFEHPTPHKLQLFVEDESSQYLECPLHVGVDMPTSVGGLSFTAPTFKTLFLDEVRPKFSYFTFDVQQWFRIWFYAP
jgi:hypothetical protein